MQINLLLSLIATLLVAVSWGTEPRWQSNGEIDKSQNRAVKGQVLISAALPAASLKFDNQFKYVGVQTFILYENARAEQHFFVDADEKGRIKRFYLVQFEGYLPHIKQTYQYKVTKAVKIGGLEFIADAHASNMKDKPGRPNSDSSHAGKFLESKGLRMGSDDILAQRLVHVADEQKRNELMIVYVEDLADMQLTAKDVAADGKAAAQWEGISNQLLERAMKGIEVVR